MTKEDILDSLEDAKSRIDNSILRYTFHVIKNGVPVDEALLQAVLMLAKQKTECDKILEEIAKKEQGKVKEAFDSVVAWDESFRKGLPKSE